MTARLITALSIGLPSLSWMIVRCQASTVTQRITEKALQGCPAAHRANVMRASACTRSRRRQRCHDLQMKQVSAGPPIS